MKDGDRELLSLNDHNRNVNRRRRWTQSEKLQIVLETFIPGTTVSDVARMHSVPLNLLFRWRKQHREGHWTSDVHQSQIRSVQPQLVSASHLQLRDLRRKLNKKNQEITILRAALARSGANFVECAMQLAAENQAPISAICQTLGVARSNISAKLKTHSANSANFRDDSRRHQGVDSLR